jgi:type II secretory pathway component PulL
MPERYGFRFTMGDRWRAVRPLAGALGLFLVIGAVVLALVQRHNDAQHRASAEHRAALEGQNRQSAADRARLNDRVDRNSDAIDLLRETTQGAIAGHDAIDARLDRIEARLGEVHRVVVGGAR